MDKNADVKKIGVKKQTSEKKRATTPYIANSGDFSKTEVPAFLQGRQKPIYLVFVYLKGKTKKLVFWLVLRRKGSRPFARYLPYTNTLPHI